MEKARGKERGGTEHASVQSRLRNDSLTLHRLGGGKRGGEWRGGLPPPPHFLTGSSTTCGREKERKRKGGRKKVGAWASPADHTIVSCGGAGRRTEKKKKEWDRSGRRRLFLFTGSVDGTRVGGRKREETGKEYQAAVTSFPSFTVCNIIRSFSTLCHVRILAQEREGGKGEERMGDGRPAAGSSSAGVFPLR